MGECCLVKIIPQKDVCIEKFADFPTLGRIAIRDGSITGGIG